MGNFLALNPILEYMNWPPKTGDIREYAEPPSSGTGANATCRYFDNG